MSPLLLGERLILLRKTLAEEAVHPAAYTRASVARAAGVSDEVLTRLEKAGGGTATSLAAVLAHYQAQGVNLAWVLVPDNADIPFFGFRDIFQEEPLPQVRKPMADLHRLLQPVMAELDAGQQLTPHAVYTLLTQVRRGVLHALKYLLPARRLLEGNADLRAFQRVLPPVLAQVAGWRPAALYTLPYHHYAAGESLPRCGDTFSYLAYDPGPMKAPDRHQCPACQFQGARRPSSTMPRAEKVA
jgi:hypothetical protein